MRRALMIVAGAGSAALLLGALGFQYLGDLPPCTLCIWQRYGHGAAIAAGLVAVAVAAVPVAILGALGAASSAGVGLFHVGVEQDWWQGPTTCAAGSIEGLSSGELLDQILAAPVVRCDDVLWEFAGLSMAGWNAVLSGGLALLWLAAAFARTGRSRAAARA